MTEPSSIKALRTAEEACTRCPLYKDASQVVPEEGPARARLMILGEQPGDQEDKQGRSFVGPAGGILAKALDDAGIDRKVQQLMSSSFRRETISSIRRASKGSASIGSLSPI